MTNQGVISVSSAKFHNILPERHSCGPNGNRTRVFGVTSRKDNHYPMRPFIITGIFNVISDGDGFEPPNLSCFYNLIKNVKPNKTLLYDSFLLREVGFEPHDLLLMRQTSYHCYTPQFMLFTGNGFSFCPKLKINEKNCCMFPYIFLNANIVIILITTKNI